MSSSRSISFQSNSSLNRETGTIKQGRNLKIDLNKLDGVVHMVSLQQIEIVEYMYYRKNIDHSFIIY